MTESKLVARVGAVFARIIEVPFDRSISMELAERWDSLAHTQLVMALEDEFGVELPFEDAITMIDGEAILTVMRKHVT